MEIIKSVELFLEHHQRITSDLPYSLFINNHEYHIIYNISKAGLLALTKTLAKDLAPSIRVNSISPGAIMWTEADAKKINKQKEILSKIPLNKTGSPNDIAKAILFLIKDADYITGQNINIDGGRKLSM